MSTESIDKEFQGKLLGELATLAYAVSEDDRYLSIENAKSEKHISKYTLPDIMKLISERDTKRDAYVIGPDDDDRYIDEDGIEHDGMLPVVQDYEDACDAESRNELREEQRKRAKERRDHEHTE